MQKRNSQNINNVKEEVDENGFDMQALSKEAEQDLIEAKKTIK